jgi:sugar/nucleoside kinase (ribokinase family)
MKTTDIYGIGNCLMDILVNVEDSELNLLGLNKGIMHLITDEQRDKLVSYIDKKPKKMVSAGSCPNTMMSLAALGLRVILAGKIGTDSFGVEYEKQILQHGVVSHLKKSSFPTGSSIILISPDSERTMSTHLGACTQFTKDDFEKEGIANAGYLYFTGYIWGSESQKEAVQEALNTAHASRTKVVFDAADPFVVKKNRQDFLSIIKDHADIVFANREEAKILFDTDNPLVAVERLAELCSIAVVKLGAEGALIKQKGSETVRIPVNKVKAVDTTGAGDVFAAGFLYGQCKKMGIEESGVFAAFLASQVVCQIGASFSEEKRKEIVNKIKNGGRDFR